MRGAFSGRRFFCHKRILKLILYIITAPLVLGGARVNRQIEEFAEEKREEIVEWILAGQEIYRDDIEYAGDWVFISVYLPR